MEEPPKRSRPRVNPIFLSLIIIARPRQVRGGRRRPRQRPRVQKRAARPAREALVDWDPPPGPRQQDRQVGGALHAGPG